MLSMFSFLICVSFHSKPQGTNSFARQIFMCNQKWSCMHLSVSSIHDPRQRTAIPTIIFDKKQCIRTANCVEIVHYSPEILKPFHLGQCGDTKKAWLWKRCELKTPKSSTRSGEVLLHAPMLNHLSNLWQHGKNIFLEVEIAISGIDAPRSQVDCLPSDGEVNVWRNGGKHQYFRI